MFHKFGLFLCFYYTKDGAKLLYFTINSYSESTYEIMYINLTFFCKQNKKSFGKKYGCFSGKVIKTRNLTRKNSKKSQKYG